MMLASDILASRKGIGRKTLASMTLVAAALLPQTLWSIDYWLCSLLTAGTITAETASSAAGWVWPARVAVSLIACALPLKLSRLSAATRNVVLIQSALALLAVESALIAYLKIPLGLSSTIAAVFLGIISGITLKRMAVREDRMIALETELSLRQKENIESQLQLVRQDEVERRLLAADLHDQVLHDLKVLRQDMKESVSAVDPSVAHNLDEQLGAAMLEIRQVMDNLCPVEIEHLGFCDAIESCIDRRAAKSGYKTLFRASAGEDDLSSLSKLDQVLLYRLVQEIINNICKHAGATVVEGEIVAENGSLIIRINDNGRGMDADALRTESRGMRYMRQRASLVGATVGWRSGKNDVGVCVEITVLPREKMEKDSG